MTMTELPPLSPNAAGDPDIESATAAAEAMLVALGVDTSAPHMQRTAERLVQAYAELLTPAPFTATDFDNVGHHRGFVIVQQVPFGAICSHHLLPFVGTATVGYLPGNRLLGLSKLARLVEQAARGLQVQEGLTQHIADELGKVVPDHGGIGVIVRAEHLCMTVRGVRARDTATVTTTWRGGLDADAGLRAEFLTLTGQR
ncbi:GTP cyclohydrolase I [Dactylosporangium siamense]|uniref:GTP cyclohydrolase 1 n=1 Tax=Dactylosporangium siamense TaxID=685454 RepID=A0A919UHY7_9ACTN|nr:GTP cyclohydrolase I [Dactylosporangium siamense]GIG52871.1 GTP cyclohydrolase 1 [Dactylosporangium siamense]